MTIREQIDKRLAAMSATKPQHTPERTQPCLEQWLLMSENVRDEYRREGFYDPSALIDPLPLLKQRDALAEALQAMLEAFPAPKIRAKNGSAPDQATTVSLCKSLPSRSRSIRIGCQRWTKPHAQNKTTLLKK